MTRVRLTHVVFLSYIAPLALMASFLLTTGCGGANEQCAGPPSVAFESTLENGLIPVGSENVVVQLVFSEDVRGVEAGSTVQLVGEATIDAVDGGPDRYDVTISGYAPGTELVLNVLGTSDGATIKNDCGDTLAADQSLTLFVDDGWSMNGDIVQGITAVPNGPFFTDIGADIGLGGEHKSGRAGLVDIDGDHIDDLVFYPVTPAEGEEYTVEVFRLTFADNGLPNYESITDRTGLLAARASLWVFGDVDGDGDQDAYSGGSSRTPSAQVGIWLNDGTGAFTFNGPSGLDGLVVGQSGGNDVIKESAAAAFGDFDGDGSLDLYVANHYSGSAAGDRYLPALDELYKGNGDGTFTKVDLPDQHNPLTSEAHPTLDGVPRAAYGIATADYDNDGDLDIFVNNYGAGRPALDSPPLFIDHNFLWRNDGNMQFTDVGVETGVSATERGIGGVESETPVVFGGQTFPGPIGGNGFGCQFGDFDNDADMDLIVGTIAHPDFEQSDRTMLHVNQGGTSPVFTEESQSRGLQYYEDELHPAMVDLDNDGLSDLAVSRLRGGSKLEFYLQYPDNSFRKETYTRTGVEIERPGPTLWTDVDNDGDLDFFMPKDNNTPGFFFRNDVGQINNALKIRLVGSTLPDATGARVTLQTSAGTLVREVTSGEGHYGTQRSHQMHFGLGQDTGAANVVIRWPNGEEQVVGDVRANVSLLITQGGDIVVL